MFPYNVDVVKEFWAHLATVKIEGNLVYLWVQGHEYDFFHKKINAQFGIIDVDDLDHLVSTARLSEGDLARFMFGGKIKLLSEVESSTHYTSDMYSMLKICSTNWHPFTNPSYSKKIQFMIMYKLVHKILFSFGKIVFDNVLPVAQSPGSKMCLPLSSLIYQLLEAHHHVDEVQGEQVPEVKKQKQKQKVIVVEDDLKARRLRKAIRATIQTL